MLAIHSPTVPGSAPTIRTSLAAALLASALACALGGASSAQNVIVVDAAGGAGSDHTDLAAAIVAARAGDILLLRSGSYPCTQSSLPTFHGFVVGKSLVLHGDAGAEPVLASELLVRQLTAASSATLRGLAIRAQPTFLLDDSDLIVWDCDGPVRVEDVQVGPNPVNVSFGGAKVSLSADVAFAHVDVDAGPGPAEGLGTRDALVWGNSSGSIHASTFRAHTLPKFPFIAKGNDGGRGLSFGNGELFLSGCTLLASDGGDSELDGGGLCSNGGNGGNAVRVETPASVLRSQACAFVPGAGGAAIAPCASGLAGVPVELAGGQHVAHAGFPRVLETTSPVREGESVHVTFRGQDGDLVLLLLSGSAHSLLVPGVVGPLLLANPSVALIGKLPSGGPFPTAESTTKSYATHDLGAGVEGVVVRLQAAFVNPMHGTFLSNESDVLLLDASL